MNARYQAPGINEVEYQALVSVSWVERRLFRATVRYAIDQARRPGTRAARVASRGGLIAAAQDVLGRQISLLGATLMWAGIVAEGAFTLAGGSSALEAPIVGALVTSGLVILLFALARISRSANLAKRYEPGQNAPPALPDPSADPVRAPRWQSWAPVVLGLEFVALGGFLMAAQYEAPRVTGAFCGAMGVCFVGVAMSANRRHAGGRAQSSP